MVLGDALDGLRAEGLPHRLRPRLPEPVPQAPREHPGARQVLLGARRGAAQRPAEPGLDRGEGPAQRLRLPGQGLDPALTHRSRRPQPRHRADATLPREPPARPSAPAPSGTSRRSPSAANRCPYRLSSTHRPRRRTTSPSSPPGGELPAHRELQAALGVVHRPHIERRSWSGEAKTSRTSSARSATSPAAESASEATAVAGAPPRTRPPTGVPLWGGMPSAPATPQLRAVGAQFGNLAACSRTTRRARGPTSSRQTRARSRTTSLR